MYEKLVSGRPWLEKLLCREEFTSHGMVSPKNMEDVITDWEGCFQRVKVLLDKYRLMEDRQIGRIASWVMEHVDEKVTLENVAAGCCSCSRLFQCRVFFQNIQKENRCHTSCLAERQEQSAEKLTLHFEDAIIFLNSKRMRVAMKKKSRIKSAFLY